MIKSRKYCKYTLEVLNLFRYNTSHCTIENCGNYVQVKVKISEFLPLLLLFLIKSYIIVRQVGKWLIKNK